MPLEVVLPRRWTSATKWASSRQLLGEYVGSLLLAVVVVGSGIMAQQLSANSGGLQLLENALVTGAGLFAIIAMFTSVSGAHLNPIVSFVDAALGGASWRRAVAYFPAQVAGCCSGAVLANLMFALPAVTVSTHHRATAAHFLSEVVATGGLILVIFALTRSGRHSMVPAAVGAYITAAYFFTSSTSFANPAITVARTLSNTFAGISPDSLALFLVAQVVGGLLGLVLVKSLFPTLGPTPTTPHGTTKEQQ